MLLFSSIFHATLTPLALYFIVVERTCEEQFMLKCLIVTKEGSHLQNERWTSFCYYYWNIDWKSFETLHVERVVVELFCNPHFFALIGPQHIIYTWNTRTTSSPQTYSYFLQCFVFRSLLVYPQFWTHKNLASRKKVVILRYSMAPKHFKLCIRNTSLILFILSRSWFAVVAQL